MTQHMIQIDSDTLNDMQGTITELQTVLRNIIWTIDRTGNTEAEQNHALGWIKYHANEALNRPGHYATETQPTA